MKRVFSLGFIGLFCLGLFIYSLTKPYYPWDMIGYVGAAISFEMNDPIEIQKHTYSMLEKSVPSETYEELTEGYHRRTRAMDPESFRQHLPFYKIRILYNVAISAFYKFGVNPFFASRIISVISACVAIVLFTLLFQGNKHSLYFIFIPLVSMGFGLHDLSRFPSPDALSTLFVSICCWFFCDATFPSC